MEPDLPTTTPWIMFAVSVAAVCLLKPLFFHLKKNDACSSNGLHQYCQREICYRQTGSSMFYIKRLKTWRIISTVPPFSFLFRPFISLCFPELTVSFTILKISTRDLWQLYLIKVCFLEKTEYRGSLCLLHSVSIILNERGKEALKVSTYIDILTEQQTDRKSLLFSELSVSSTLRQEG